MEIQRVQVLPVLVAHLAGGRWSPTCLSPRRSSSAGARMARLATLLAFALVAGACAVSSGSVAIVDTEGATSEVVEAADSAEQTTPAPSDTTPMPAVTATPEAAETPVPTEAPASTATSAPIEAPAPTETPVPSARAAFAATPGPTATLAAAGVGSDGFELIWDILIWSVADIFPDQPTPPELPDGTPGSYVGLELTSYKLSDGVLLATSLADARIDGYVLFFDPDSVAALQSIVMLSFVLDEVVITDSVVDIIYGDGAISQGDMPLSFDGASHRIELTRTGADPVNDPLWILTALPKDSVVDHDTLRLAGAEAALASF